MQVFKFGGASVKDAEGVRNLAKIIELYPNEKLVVVVSAMAKTTNALEKLTESYISGKVVHTAQLVLELKAFHLTICDHLFKGEKMPVYGLLENFFNEMERILNKPPALEYDFNYDQIVSFGELLSTTIIAEFLNFSNLSTKWIDIRETLKTDNTFREANVNWELSGELTKPRFSFNETNRYVTQGFLGSTVNNLTTTLGREGSDYTAAILAYILNATQVVIWKDVPGVLNADPKWFDRTELLPKLSYLDAIELAYYGASVIHPKTIQPLENKNITLCVKSFLHPNEPGTVIGNEMYDKLIPSFIFKMDQVMMNISALDFSFIAENHLEILFRLFAENSLRINLMQNTALHFEVCINNDETRIPRVLSALNNHFKVETEYKLELITIRYFDQKTIERVMVNKELIVEQRSKNIIQMVVRGSK